MRAATAPTPLPSSSRRCSEAMDAAPQPSGRGRGVIGGMVALPQRLFLSVVSAGVMGGLALGAASVWLAATFGASRRRD